MMFRTSFYVYCTSFYYTFLCALELLFYVSLMPWFEVRGGVVGWGVGTGARCGRGLGAGVGRRCAIVAM